MDGYYKEEEQTSETIKDGWLIQVMKEKLIRKVF